MAHIHDELLEVFWPSSEPVSTGGIRDRGLLESAVARPFHSAFRVDAYPTVIEKGLALFHSLIANHPFADGNKRTAVTALEHFLLANGFVLGIPNSIMYNLATRTASYRERHETHERSLAYLVSSTTELIVPMAQFKADIASVPTLEGTYEAMLRLRTGIRRHRFNHLIGN